MRRNLPASPVEPLRSLDRPPFMTSFYVERETTANGHVILHPVGELESATIAIFRQAAADLDPGQNVIINMARVPFLDSCGIGALIGVVRRVRELQGRIVLASACSPVRRVLHLTGCDRIVELVETLPQAALLLERAANEPSPVSDRIAI